MSRCSIFDRHCSARFLLGLEWPLRPICHVQNVARLLIPPVCPSHFRDLIASQYWVFF
jgi:hypothetical protein